MIDLFVSFSGAEKDLKVVTDMAYKQIKNYGMSKTFGHVSFAADDDEGSQFAPKPYSKRLGALLDHEARQLVAKAYKRAEQLLRENEDKLRKVNLRETLDLLMIINN